MPNENQTHYNYNGLLDYLVWKKSKFLTKQAKGIYQLEGICEGHQIPM